MKTTKIIALLMLVLLSFSLFGCDESKDLEKIAKKNRKEIVGTWTVESLETIEAKSLADFGAVLTTGVLFGKDAEVKFLSNGTFLTGVYNLEYELVDDQFIYTYEGQTFGYDLEMSDGEMILSTPGVISVTLKKQ